VLAIDLRRTEADVLVKRSAPLDRQTGMVRQAQAQKGSVRLPAGGRPPTARTRKLSP